MDLSDSEAKVLAGVILGVGTLLTGLSPACLTRRRGEPPLWLSLMLCFGAGVLLATALGHLLPEIWKVSPEYAVLLLFAGFILLYFFDVIVDFVRDNVIDLSSAEVHSHQGVTTQSQEPSRDGHSHYGSVSEEEPTTSNIPASCCGEKENLLRHGSQTEPKANTRAGLLGLLIALSQHALFEGLAIGLQKDGEKVFVLMGAVASHKLVVGFCLGTEFATTTTRLIHFIAILVNAGASVLGIGIGALVSQIEAKWVPDVLMPILQGIAAGSLLYVSLSEILPRERARWHGSPRRVAGLLQCVVFSCGLILMSILSKYTA